MAIGKLQAKASNLTWTEGYQDGQHRLNATYRCKKAESDADIPDPIIWISMGYAREAMLVESIPV